MRIAIGCDDTGFALKSPSWRPSRPTGTTSSTSAPSRPTRWTIRTTPGRSARRCSGASWTRACSSARSGAGGVDRGQQDPGHPRGALSRSRTPPGGAARRTTPTCSASPRPGSRPRPRSRSPRPSSGRQFQAGDPQSRQVAKIGQLEAGLLGADKAPLKPAEEKGAPKAAGAPSRRREAGRGRPRAARPEAPAPPARAASGSRGDDAGAGAAGPAQAARGGGDAALPRGARVPGPPLGEGRDAVEGRRRHRAQPARLAHLAHHHAQPRGGHPDLRGRDPAAPVLAGGPARAWAAPP